MKLARAFRSCLSCFATALLCSFMGMVGIAQQPDTAATLAFLEGPTVDRDGNVYFVEMTTPRIMKLGADGVLTIYRDKSNNANGLVIDAEGRLIACEGAESNRNGVKVPANARITRTDLRTGAMEVLATSYEGTPLRGPNDVTLDRRGRIYFTDLAGSAVYRIDTNGTLARILSSADVQRPNGIQISPDDTRLYVADSFPPPTNTRRIHVFDLSADGSAHNGRVLYDFGEVRGADGMSIDVEGNLYAAAGSAATKNTGIHVISPQGKLIKVMPIPEDPITNNAFGGADMKTLYVTAGKTLFRLRTDVAGLPR
jgi:gluconolactonase